MSKDVACHCKSFKFFYLVLLDYDLHTWWKGYSVRRISLLFESLRLSLFPRGIIVSQFCLYTLSELLWTY